VGRTVVARWRDATGLGLEHCVVREDAGGVHAVSVLIGGEGDPRFAARYRIDCDARWQLRRAEIAVAGDPRIVRLEHDGAGGWTEAGTPLPGFADARDIDIAATPFTNTLPIRRLGLREGQAAEIIAVYLAVPALTITAAPQRYTCLQAGRRYRFESLDADFVRELEVDDDGLVVSYPGLFQRIG
jgi:hypothetical protein